MKLVCFVGAGNCTGFLALVKRAIDGFEKYCLGPLHLCTFTLLNFNYFALIYTFALLLLPYLATYLHPHSIESSRPYSIKICHIFGLTDVDTIFTEPSRPHSCLAQRIQWGGASCSNAHVTQESSRIHFPINRLTFSYHFVGSHLPLCKLSLRYYHTFGLNKVVHYLLQSVLS